MVKVEVYKQANYPLKTARIKKMLADFFSKKGIVSDAEISVAIVGEKKMLAISRKYLKDNKLHNVLSFTPGEERFVYGEAASFASGEAASFASGEAASFASGEAASFASGEAASFAYPPDGILHLGEIILCYPLIVEEAKRENKLIEEKALELIEHGAYHLLGIHHE